MNLFICIYIYIFFFCCLMYVDHEKTLESLRKHAKNLKVPIFMKNRFSKFFVLKKKYGSKIHPLASANLKTVAIRFPEHTVVRSILKKIKSCRCCFIWFKLHSFVA